MVDIFRFAPSFLHSLIPSLPELANNTPRTPSPLLHSFLRLPEFGEDGAIIPTTDTPSSTTAELDHGAEMSPFIAAVQPLLASIATDLAPEEPGWDFTFITHDIADNSPPARPPSPVSPVHPCTCDCPAPNDGDMAMEIRWWPCNGCCSIAIPVSSRSAEVRLSFSFVGIAWVLNNFQDF